MVEKKELQNIGYGLFAKKDYKPQEIVFTETEWYSQTENWISLTVEEIEKLSTEDRETFLRYSYDISLGISRGTFEEASLQNPGNFINHSCDPNLAFDGEDNIRTIKAIANGEEFTIDYASFVVNFDQDFECKCGAPTCRIYIRKEDWRQIINAERSNVARFIKDLQT